LAAAKTTAYVAWVAICVIWGTSYLAIKIALETLSPLLVTGLRYAVAGALLLAWLVVARQGLPPARSWPGMAAVGVLMLGVGNGFLVAAEQYVHSGLAAVLVSTTPFWMAGVERFQRGGERVSAVQWLGLLVGFGGILLLVWPEIFTGAGVSWAFAGGVLALQLACLGWAFGSAIGKRQALAASPVQSSAAQMASAGVAVLAVATVSGDWAGLGAVSARSVAAMAYLTVVASLIAFVAYTYALAHLPTSFVSLYAYVNPVVAVALGAAAAGEPFTGRIAIAMVLILVSTAIVSSQREDPAARRPR
jgi:drug/metabolite transporter (DMT)-like permease